MVFETVSCILISGLFILIILKMLLKHNKDKGISKFHLGKFGLDIEFSDKEKATKPSKE